MALGPHTTTERRRVIVAEAERKIDHAVRGADRLRVTLSVDLLRITPQEWATELRPKYLAAGWQYADWQYDQRDGDFIDLRMDGAP